MGEIVNLSDSSQVRDDASLWITRIDRGLSERERSELRQWLEQDESHKAMLLKVGALWDDLDVLTQLSSILPLEAASPSPVARPPAREHRNFWSGAAIAGGLVVAAGTLAVYMIPGIGPTPARIDAEFHDELHAAIGELERSTLPDGSVVTLNTGTSADVNLGVATREITLRRGEAYFEVTHDVERPFIVHAGDQIVTAIGTAFSVHIEDENSVEVIVVDGRVSVAARSSSTGGGSPRPDREEEPASPPVLVPGDVALIRNDSQEIIRVDENALQARLSWQRGVLIFDGQPLDEVLAEFNRYTNRKLILADENLSEIRVGGYYPTDSVDALLVSLRKNFRIESDFADDGIYLRSAPDPTD